MYNAVLCIACPKCTQKWKSSRVADKLTDCLQSILFSLYLTACAFQILIKVRNKLMVFIEISELKTVCSVHYDVKMKRTEQITLKINKNQLVQSL